MEFVENTVVGFKASKVLQESYLPIVIGMIFYFIYPVRIDHYWRETGIYIYIKLLEDDLVNTICFAVFDTPYWKLTV